MIRIKSAFSIAAIVICLYRPALSAVYTIDNPADKIKNPAEKIYNPASDIKNPASNIYNPASRMEDPNPLSTPNQTVSDPTVTKAVPASEQPMLKSKRGIPIKYYDFKTVTLYIVAIKKAFNKDDYIEFLSLTEDALRRIGEGTLKASTKTKLKLKKYRKFGYGLLEKVE
jgi:hypothetical protein